MRTEALFWLLVLEHYKARLLASIEVTEAGCWEWRKSGDGRYGHFYMLGVKFKSHVASAILWRGIYLRSARRVLRHQCDNASCCNPGHLKPGSQKENRQEASERGRVKHGLTKATVARIRNLITRGYTDTQIVERVKKACHRTTVMRIRKGTIR